MSVTPNQIALYGSANMPEADSVTVGGAIDLTKRVSFYDIGSNMSFDVVSSSASDTATKIQVTGRDSTGTIQTPAAVTLNGQTLITTTFGAQVFERLLSGVITGGAIGSLTNPGGTAAVGDVALLGHTRVITSSTAQVGSANTSGTTPPLMKLAAGQGATLGALTYSGLGLVIRTLTGTGANQIRYIIAPYSAGAYGTDVVAINRDWGTIPDATTTYDISYGMVFDISPNAVTAITRCFATAQADVPGGSSRTFYEKIFCLNQNATTALTAAAIQVLSETSALPGSAALDLALCSALNDTATAANRQTAPSGTGGFVVQPSPINIIASPGSLPAGGTATQAQGMWLRLTLPAGTTAYKGTADIRTTGSTT